MPRPENHDVLICAGEFFLDLIFYGLRKLPALGEELKTDNFAFSLGGGAAITAAAASRLGRSTKLVTVWGDSPMDAEARARLREFGVDPTESKSEVGLTSGLTVAVSTEQDRYFLTCPGANRFVETYLLSPEAFGRLSRAGHVHLALTPTHWSPFRSLAKDLQQAGVKVSWDLGWDPKAAESEGFRQICGELDVLFVNEMEALHYTGTQDPLQALRRLSTSRNTVVIKMGEKGSVATALGGDPAQAPAIEVEAVETTGAGDAFNGGFLHAWMDGRPLEESLLAGNICGGLSTRSAGGVAALPTRQEFHVLASGERSRLFGGGRNR